LGSGQKAPIKFMKIDHIDGSSTDTDQLSDIEEMILVKWKELEKICIDNNRPFCLFINPNGDSKSYTIFWHHAGRNNISKEGDINISPFLNVVGKYVEAITQNQLSIQSNE
jgi:hypothetical protein